MTPMAASAVPPREETQRLSTTLLSCWKKRATAMGAARATMPLRWSPRSVLVPSVSPSIISR